MKARNLALLVVTLSLIVWSLPAERRVVAPNVTREPQSDAHPLIQPTSPIHADVEAQPPMPERSDEDILLIDDGRRVLSSILPGGRVIFYMEGQRGISMLSDKQNPPKDDGHRMLPLPWSPGPVTSFADGRRRMPTLSDGFRPLPNQERLMLLPHVNR